MTVNYYQIPPTEYRSVFEIKCNEIADLLASMEAILDSKNISLVALGPKVSWNIFEELVSATNEDCRQWLKTNNLKQLESIEDYIPIQRADLQEKMTKTHEEVCALKEVINTVTEKLNCINNTLSTLSRLTAELVPPPAEPVGVDMDALDSEYSTSLGPATGADKG